MAAVDTNVLAYAHRSRFAKHDAATATVKKLAQGGLVNPAPMRSAKSSRAMTSLLCAAALAVSLAGCGDDDSGSADPLSIGQGSYVATVESLETHRLPDWFRRAKLGIFIHWGAYSVPAYAIPNLPTGLGLAEWYWFFQLNLGPFTDSLGAPLTEYHLQTFGADVAYDDFLDMWTADEFDADEWADLIRQSGAKYTVLVTKHHDGIALWNTKTTDRNTVKFGPKRDLVDEFAAAIRKQGDVKLGLYYSFLEWYHPDYDGDDGALILGPLELPQAERINPYTGEAAPYKGYLPIDDFFTQHIAPQMRELIDDYDPDLLWWDGDWDLPAEKWFSYEHAAYFYNQAEGRKEVAINDRVGRGSRWRGDYRTVEYRDEPNIAEDYFESTRGLASSFAHNAQIPLDEYLTPES